MLSICSQSNLYSVYPEKYAVVQYVVASSNFRSIHILPLV